jgi:putative endonuclease
MGVWLYILELKSGKLYVGVTEDLQQRMELHRRRTACRTTRLDPMMSRVYAERHPTLVIARRREAQIKRWTRAKKEALIRGDMNSLKTLAKRCRP